MRAFSSPTPLAATGAAWDEAGGGEHRSFTGAFVGVVAFGASGGEIAADLRYFNYEGRVGADEAISWIRQPQPIHASKRQ